MSNFKTGFIWLRICKTKKKLFHLMRGSIPIILYSYSQW